jgi:flavorubredoxin
MFTCDAFGSHFSDEKMLDYKVKEDVLEFKNYWDSSKTYFDCIVSPFKEYVLKAIDKVKDIDMQMVCPGHGLIHTEYINKMVGLYKEWSTPAEIYDGLKRVTIVYVSAYGYTKSMAEKLYEGLNSVKGVKAYIYDLVDSELTKEDVLEKIEFSSGIMVGSPTITANVLKPVNDILSELNPLKQKGKESFAFGSYGWSGEAVGILEDRLKTLKLKKTFDGVKVNFKPTEEELENLYNIAVEFGKKILE